MPDLSSQRVEERNKQKRKEEGGKNTQKKQLKNEKGRRQSRARGVGRAARRPRLRRDGSPAQLSSPRRLGRRLPPLPPPRAAAPGSPRPLPTTALPPSASTAPTEGLGPTGKTDPRPGPSAPGSRRGSWACPAQAAPMGLRRTASAAATLSLPAPHGARPAPPGRPSPARSGQSGGCGADCAGAAVIPHPPQAALAGPRRAAPHPSVVRFLLEL